VAFFLERQGWSLERLLRSGMSMEEAEKEFAAAARRDGREFPDGARLI
jgi:hypothetical protein